MPVQSRTQICRQLHEVAFVSLGQAGACALRWWSSDRVAGPRGDLVRAVVNHQVELMLGDVLDAAARSLHGCNRLGNPLLPPPAIRCCCSMAQLSSAQSSLKDLRLE